MRILYYGAIRPTATQVIEYLHSLYSTSQDPLVLFLEAWWHLWPTWRKRGVRSRSFAVGAKHFCARQQFCLLDGACLYKTEHVRCHTDDCLCCPQHICAGRIIPFFGGAFLCQTEPVRENSGRKANEVAAHVSAHLNIRIIAQ